MEARLMSKNILVIDDDLAILEVLKIILEDSGYAVTSISSGSDIQRKVNEKKPDLILLDIWISGHDGRDIAHTLKNNKSSSNIPIIVMSAHNETKRIAHEAGVDDFLAKPFDMNDLIAIVKKYTHSPS